MKEHIIEQDLIHKLTELKYIYRPEITTLKALEENFRQKFEALNKVNLSDSEFDRLLQQIVTKDVFIASQNLRQRNTFERDDGTPLNFTMVNTKDWCKNSFEVINQLKINTHSSHHRYDVILLINGVPAVQIELKTLNITPRRAMQQIVDYKNDPGNGYSKTLMCFMQLFVVSNQSNTYYFTNNNNRHFSFHADERFLPVYQFADKDNRKIAGLYEFADKFLAKCTLGEMISKYMVLIETEQKLMMMRPYQIYAVKAIVDCIKDNCGNGYIWHTTGSGKTLTSFKASTLLKDNDDIEKCLFVVDRKDLDKQTRDEFNRFQEKCVEQNTNTSSMVERLLSNDKKDKVIVTTIQKLGVALDGTHKKNYKERLEPLRDKRIVFIFDECHRSQFGENHKAIREFFPNAQLFGFTGTPIFDDNASYRKIDGTKASYKTTEDIFQKELHAYTITHAIEDKNVLKFHIDYFKPDGKNPPKPNETIAKQAIIEAILHKHDAATAYQKFNAVLATSSINDAIEYYDLLQKIQRDKLLEDQHYKPLNIVCVFSPPAEGNADVKQIQEDLPQEKADNQIDPKGKKAALNRIIHDYNQLYGANHTISEFDLYYQDVQKRIKDQQYPNEDHPHSQKIDIVIVVDMLLTGFDSKYLNTLYVDKNLKHHGLIQAFSRTNRVLNDTKPNGNILDFRGQKDSVDAAIKLFSGGQDDEKSRKIWLVEDAPVVIDKMQMAVKKLDAFMFSQGLENTPENVANLKGDAARCGFVGLFKEVQRLKTQLDQYTDLTEDQADKIESIIPKDELQAFKGVYLDTASQLKEKQNKPSDDTPPELEQLDFEFVLFASSVIDYDYIMSLLADASHSAPAKEKTTREELIRLIESDAKFMDEREDIVAYIHSIPLGKSFSEEEFKKGYEKFKSEKSDRDRMQIAKTHGLGQEALKDFVSLTMKRMVFDGDGLRDLLLPLGLGWKERRSKELELMKDLAPLLRKLAKGRDISGLNAYE